MRDDVREPPNRRCEVGVALEREAEVREPAAVGGRGLARRAVPRLGHRPRREPADERRRVRRPPTLSLDASSDATRLLILLSVLVARHVRDERPEASLERRARARVHARGFLLRAPPRRDEFASERPQRLDAFPLVLQYNKRDVADPFAIEELHRQIGFDQAAVFETIATTGHGILSSLTTISKHVVRARRGQSGELDPRAAAEAAPELEAVPELQPDVPVLEATTLDETPNATSTAELLESAILAEGDEKGFQTVGAIEVELGDHPPDWVAEEAPIKPSEGTLRVISVGQATVEADGGVRLPLVLGDEEGASRSVVLSLRLDALAIEDGSN